MPLLNPRDSIREFIQQKLLIGGSLGGDDAPLFTGGAVDSLGILELIAFLEKRFKVRIDPRQHSLHEFDTINSIVRLLDKLADGQIAKK